MDVMEHSQSFAFSVSLRGLTLTTTRTLPLAPAAFLFLVTFLMGAVIISIDNYKRSTEMMTATG
jgi:hypothetical protein